MSKHEQWRAVVGAEGRYEVSSLGRVRSITRRVRFVSKAGTEASRVMRGRVLAQGNCRGYRIVNIPPLGTLAVHRLVLEAFTAERGETVNHKDGDKTNNRRANLEWATRSANQQHAVDTGLRTQCKPVIATKGRSRRRFPSTARAAAWALCDELTIRDCIRGLRATAGGYVWSYA